MQRVHKRVTGISATNRSRVTNGTSLLDGIDGRNAIARRFRDILRGYEEEFTVATEAERVPVCQAATLAVLSEQLQAKLINGELIDADTISKVSGHGSYRPRRPYEPRAHHCA